MISLYKESHLSTFTIIFYIFIWIPFLKISQSVIRFFAYLLNPHQLPGYDHFQDSSTSFELDLPVSVFRDLSSGIKAGEIEKYEECSICLIEFEKEDLVNKLARCGHVFHMECMEKWINRCQFTCPLCRSLVLHVPSSSSCKIWDSAFCILSPANNS